MKYFESRNKDKKVEITSDGVPHPKESKIEVVIDMKVMVERIS